MFRAFQEFLATWRQLQAFQSSPESKRQLVVYSEGSQDWPHLGPILESYLKQDEKAELSYLSSGSNDPGLQFVHPRFHAYFIGSGTTRTIFFKGLQARVCLMSLPDLDVFELKRSAYGVHYVYAFHSINSSHTVYRDRAFEHFDTLFCVGPHHVDELRREEVLKNLKPRRLLEHGSVKLDTVVAQYSGSKAPDANETPFILLAPSWGECSFAEDGALVRAMIQQVLAQGWICSLRFHPMTLRHHPKLIESLQLEFGAQKNFFLETDLNNNESFRRAHLMVSDWSGAATEFSFALGKPVLFIDTPQKINNPDWQAFDRPALERIIRTEIGSVIEPGQISDFANSIQKLLGSGTDFRRVTEEARSRWIFNVGRAAEAGATHLHSILSMEARN
jgi:hypothetical protein